MAASQDGEPMPDYGWPGQPGDQQLPGKQEPAGDWSAWYAPASERVGRHGATAPDLNETLLLPPLHGATRTDELRLGPDLRPAGRHASAPEEPAQQPASDPRPAVNGTGDTSKLRLIWVYPDLLSTYGDRGNLLVLSRRARLRGIEVEAIEVNSDQPVPRQGDIYLLGGGEDLPQILAASPAPQRWRPDCQR